MRQTVFSYMFGSVSRDKNHLSSLSAYVICKCDILNSSLIPSIYHTATPLRWPWLRQAEWTYARSSPIGSHWHKWRKPSTPPKKVLLWKWWSACSRMILLLTLSKKLFNVYIWGSTVLQIKEKKYGKIVGAN